MAPVVFKLFFPSILRKAVRDHSEGVYLKYWPDGSLIDLHCLHSKGNCTKVCFRSTLYSSNDLLYISMCMDIFNGKWKTSRWKPERLCYLAVGYIIAYIMMQLHIIHQRSRIMIVYYMISEVFQNNLICIIRFHGIDTPTLFQWTCQ